jgi:hypothetical protein
MSRLTIAAAAFVAAGAVQGPNRELLLNPDHPAMQQRAPDACRILLDTTKGPIMTKGSVRPFDEAQGRLERSRKAA